VSRVGINASIVGERPTGLGLYSIMLVRELDSIRDDLVVYTAEPERFGRLRARTARAPRAVRPENRIRGHLARWLWLQGPFRRRVRRDRPGLIFNTIPEGIIGSAIAQVTVVHDLLPIFFPGQYPRQQHYLRWLVPKVLRSSRLVVTDSENTRRDVVATYGLSAERVRVVYPGYDEAEYFADGATPASDRSHDPCYLYVGNLLPHKNVLGLVDAFAIVRRRRRCRLIIRGQGRPAYARAVRERVEKLGLADAVTFVGYLEIASLRDLYYRATCLVMPSLYEGFGLPALEAMACGTPVITSANSSLPEVVGDAALTVDPRDSASLADTMDRVASDADLRDELRERGVRRAKSFSWRRTAEGISQAIEEAVAPAIPTEN
jgi:glycosyltransferase involved in cell wall biosynthesis